MRSRNHIAIVLVYAVLAAWVGAGAGVPQLINYQGRLTSSAGAPVTATISITFTIYDDSTDGTVKWTETQPSVVVTDGFFSVKLGSVNPLDETVFSDAGRFLGITVGSDPEITPRTRITSTGYAHQVGSIDGASGGTITGPLMIAPYGGKSAWGPEHAGAPMVEIGVGVAINLGGARQGAMHLLNVSGAISIDLDGQDTTVGIGTALPQANLHVDGTIYVLGGTGDVDGSGSPSITDANLIISYLAKQGSLTPAQLARGDMDGDARVTSDDLTILMYYLFIGLSKTDAIRRVHSTYGASPDVVNAPDAFYVPGEVGIGTSTPAEKLHIEWDSGVDAEVGRGTTDPDITYMALRNANGTKCYIYPDAAGTGIVVSTTKP